MTIWQSENYVLNPKFLGISYGTPYMVQPRLATATKKQSRKEVIVLRLLGKKGRYLHND